METKILYDKLLIKADNIKTMVQESSAFEEYNAYHEDAKHDPELELYYILRDLVYQLKQKRIEMKITQKEVAEKMQTKQAAISRFEYFQSQPTIEFLFKYAKAIGEELKIEMNINDKPSCKITDIRNYPNNYKNMVSYSTISNENVGF